MSSVIEAPAKVNLHLHVTGRRDDGYHLLDSLVVFAGVGDTLSFAPADTLLCTVDGPTAHLLPPAGGNIVLKAAEALAAATCVAPKAAIHLTKRLPVAAGIGGGSTDAAAALKGLAALWGVVVPDGLALKLGADVPVCLAGRPMAMSGVGERLAPAPELPPAWLVLVNPGVPLSTPAVFKARTGGFSAPDPLAEPLADAPALAAALGRRRNDLTDAAILLAPVVGDVLAAIQATRGCLLARMSGSGATCFGLYATEAEARAAEAALAGSGWWVSAAALLP